MAIVAQFLRRSLAPLLIAVSAAANAVASESMDRHARMTAAYVFNFIKFVEWPLATSADTIDVCFVGADLVRDALMEAAANRTADARRISVRAVGERERVLGCEVLYVDARSTLAVPLGSGAALSIGDAPDFTERGGVIRLYVEDNRLRFTVNMRNANRARVQVSSNLLKLASRVELQDP